jgi:ubiquinone/menaquinone biosynthesis C-methylase UbiE
MRKINKIKSYSYLSQNEKRSSKENQHMSTNANFWRRWWDKRSRDAVSDYEADRVTSFRNKEMERHSEKEFLDFVNPKPTDFLFDAGCGTGIDVYRLSSRVGTIVAMDHSQGMIERAEKRLKRENMLNASFFTGSVSEIPLKDNSFDKIICMSVLQYLNDKECKAALNELVRISKHKSVIVFHVKNLFSLYLLTLYLAKKIKSLFSKKPVMEHYRPYWWYETRLSRLGGTILDYNSVNKFVVDFLPKFIFQKIQKLEFKCYKGRIFKRFGADYKIKAQIYKK